MAQAVTLATLILTTLLAQNPAPTSKPQVMSERQAIEAISSPFFAKVIAGEYKAGLEGLSTVFAIGGGKQGYLADRMQQLEKKLGRAFSVRAIGLRRLPGTQEVFAVYFMSYHPLKPAIWELTFYKVPAHDKKPAKWLLTSVRFETEKIFELLEGTEKWKK